jgi:hypothetical protein
MKNLTENQQEIIDLIINEFQLINEQKATENDDIFAYIDSAVNEKKLYAEEMKHRNEAYRNVIDEKVDATIERISNIVNRYGFTCDMDSTREDDGIVEYFLLRICGGGEAIKYFYLYTNRERREGITSYADTDVKIYLSFQRMDGVKDCDLDKCVADALIRRLKSQIY